MKKTYEAWEELQNGNRVSVTLATSDGIKDQFSKGLLSPDARLLYVIEADTFEEAQAVHHIKMGWSPYQPMGEPAPCSSCGSMYYPHGSGECPHCGKIS